MMHTTPQHGSSMDVGAGIIVGFRLARWIRG